MKNLMKKLLTMALALSVLLAYQVPAFAEEVPSEEPVVEEPVVEEPVVEDPVVEEPAPEEPAVEEPAVEEPAPEDPTTEEPEEEAPAFSAVVTLTVDSEVNFILNEDGSVAGVEGSDPELVAALAENEGSLADLIDYVLGLYEEDVEYDLTLVTTDEEFAASITEPLADLLGDEEVEVELGLQPERIAQRFALAKEYGITAGKMRLLEKLGFSSEEEVDLSEWAEKDVKVIMEQIKANKKSYEDEVETEDEIVLEKASVKKVSKSKGQGRSKAKNK